MKESVRKLREQGDRLFADRSPLLSLWQAQAENFYPLRADFTRTRSISEEFASYLMTSRPPMAHRDLANALSAMLRPRDEQWFHARTNDEKVNEDRDAKDWLDSASQVMRAYMYNSRARFVRATKEGDHDFTAFGQCVISVEPNRVLDGLLYRDWHLRDVVWRENAEGEINEVHRKWKPEASQLVELFPKTVDQKVRDLLDKEPAKKIECRHIVLENNDYDFETKPKRKPPFVSIYIDVDNDTILEESGSNSLGYVIPRWATISDSQYAYSPAAVYGLPDARMLQQITLTLLEAGQKVVDPPMIAIGSQITGGINLFAGGITNADADYDERTGEVLRPITLKPEGLNWGDEREARIEKAIQEVFYLNRIALPEVTKEMTAFETQKLYEDFIRQSLPLFEPVTVEYNGSLCEATFNHLMAMGRFGSPFDMPEKLMGHDLKFEFETPMKAAAAKAKVQAFQTSGQIVAAAAQLDPSSVSNFDVDKAARDAVGGTGAPADWLRSEDEVKKMKAASAQVAQQQAAATAMAHGADVATRVAGAAKSAGEARQALQGAGVI